MLAHQDGEAGQQFRAHRLAHQRVVMAPVEHALRIELGVVGVADVEDVFPRDQHVVEHHGGVELVALRRQRMLDRIGLDQAFAADDGDAFQVRRADAVDDLVALGAGAEEHAEMQEIAERGSRADRLHAVDEDAFVVGREDAQRRRIGVRVGVGAVGLRIDEMRRDDQIVVHRLLPEVADVVGKPAAVGADRTPSPTARDRRCRSPACSSASRACAGRTPRRSAS